MNDIEAYEPKSVFTKGRSQSASSLMTGTGEVAIIGINSCTEQTKYTSEEAA